MRLRAIRRAFVLALVATAVVAAGARAGPGLFVGVDDDTLKWTEDTPSVVNQQRDLGATAVRITLQWHPGQSVTDADQRTYLRRAQSAARLGQRVVLSILGPASSPPVTPGDQDQFCAFGVEALGRARNIRDVVIWNEVNSALFWRPQQGAAAAYESLLADCYDALHKLSKAVNVISSTSPHENPGAFIAQLGAAFRASGRTSPIFDTFAHDAYPEVSSESPLATHAGTLSIDQGDYVRLMQALTDAFGGSWQVVPGAGYSPSGGYLPAGQQMSTKTGLLGTTSMGGPVTIWYLEDGFETVIPNEERGAYEGRETNRQLVQPVPVPPPGGVQGAAPPSQAGQLRDALELAYCQPAVGAFFNFEVQDETGLGGWQSGLLYADGRQKPSYALVKAEIAAVAAGQVDCSRFPSAVSESPAGSATSGSAPAATPSP
jgi:hypothetical protein